MAGYKFSNWEGGYGDIHLVPDLGTIRKLSWLDRTALVICDAEVKEEHVPVAVAPRSILRKQVEKLLTWGLDAMAGSKLEYYQFRTSYSEAAQSGYRDLRESGWYIEDYHLLQEARMEDLNGAFRRHLAASGVAVESTKGEFGRGNTSEHPRRAGVGDGSPPFGSETGGERNLRPAWVNSYKRSQSGSWAPTALAWSPDNRTAGFSVVDAGPRLQIECRIPGADVNPYFAYSAVIASGLAGIE